MTRTAEATQPNQLDSIVELIHDFWFDYDGTDPELSGLSFDPERKQLSIDYFWEDWDNIKRDRAGFFLKSKGELPLYRATLRIEGVEQLEVDDRSAIGGSSFNTLRYDPGKANCASSTITTSISSPRSAISTSLCSSPMNQWELNALPSTSVVSSKPAD